MKKGIARFWGHLVTIVAMMILIVPALPAQSADAVNLVILPSTQTISVGSTFNITVQAQCGSLTTDGTETYIDFDPTYLAVQSATAGTALSTILMPPTFDNTAGTFGLSAGIQLSTPAPSGTFTVVTIVFQAKSATTAPTAVTFHFSDPRKTFVDSGGSDITGSLTGGNYTIQDTTPPGVISVSPTLGAIDVPINLPIVLTFSKGMNQSATQGAFSISPTVAGSFSWNTAGTIMTFTPGSNLAYSTIYTVSLSIAAMDTAGIHLATPYSATFATVAKVNLAILPSTLTIGVGSTFNITVQAQCGSLTTDGTETYLDFDPTYLAVQSATAGTTLSTILISPTFNNTAGTFGFSAGIQLSTQAPGGTFTVATITFQAKNVKTDHTNITFHTSDPRKTLVDWFGTDVTGNLSGGTYAIQDPPVVTAISPTIGSPDVQINSSIIFTFSKGMNQSATQGAFSISPTVAGSFSWNTAGTIMTFTPGSNLAYNTIYTVSLSIAAMDTAGIHLAAPYSSTFTTIKGLTSTSVTTSASPSSYGQSVTFTANVSAVLPATGTPTGTVTFKDGTLELGTGNLNSSGQATYSTSNLSVRSHSITAVYSGDGNFTLSTSTAIIQTVNKGSSSSVVTSSANPSIFGQSVTLTATISAVSPAPSIPTGSVSFKDGTSELGTGNLNSSGQATYSTSNLSVGSHPITAVYSGDANYLGITSSILAQEVRLASTITAVTSSVNPSSYGQSVIFTATVSVVPPSTGTPTGTATFKDGETILGTAILNGSGQATYSTPGLSAGIHSISAVYGGDINFASSTKSLTQTVNKGSSSTTITSLLNPSTYGQLVTFNVTVSAVSPATTPPTGMVSLKDGNVTLGTWNLSSGQVSCTPSALSTGIHSITAVYSGDGNYNSSTSSPITQNINQGTTVTVVTSLINPSVYGQTVTFNATVSAVLPATGTPTGTVTFKDGTSELGTGNLNSSGQASYSTSALSVGSHSITAVYSGDGNFTVSTSTAIIQTINKGSSSSVVTSSANPSIFGQSVTLTATISAVSPAPSIPTGSVFFQDGATVLGTGPLNASGEVTYVTSALSTGIHSITAVYSGDGNYNSSVSSPITQNINQGITVTVATSLINPTVYGQTVTFHAVVSAVPPANGTPTGTVTFKDGTSELGTGNLNSSGQAIYSTSALSVGSHSITAVYNGNTNFITSTSPTLTQMVTQASSITVMTSSANPSASRLPVTLTATVSAVSPAAGTPTGTITFKEGANILGTRTLDSSGQTTYFTVNLTSGSYHINADYGGDANFLSSSGTLTQQVVESSTITTVGSTPNPSTYGRLVTFNATISAVPPATGTPTGTVTFKDGETILGTAILNGSGQATYTTSNLSVGIHDISALYLGDIFASSTGTLTQTVNKGSSSTLLTSSSNASIYGQLVTFNVTVSAATSATSIPTGTVTLKDGTSELGSWNLSAGQAACTISSLSAGNHSIIAVYSGDTNYEGSISPVFIQTVQQALTTTILTSSAKHSEEGQSVTLTATVNSEGSGIIVSGTVDFLEGATTLASGVPLNNGIATYTTSPLSLGKYNFKAIYDGDANNKGSSFTFEQQVNPASVTALSSSANPSTYGKLVTFNVTVGAVTPATSTPTGPVTLKDGMSDLGTWNLSSGQVVFSISALSFGTHPIDAYYDGDNNFAFSTANLTQVVNQGLTATKLISSANPSTLGQSVTFTATVSAIPPAAGSPTGTINFTDGATILGTWNLSDPGQPTLTTSILSTGSHSITALYGGDNNFSSSTSSVLIQEVQGTGGGGGGGGGGSSVQLPAVTSVSPADQSTGIAIDTPVKAVFSKPMNASTLTANSFTLKNGNVAVSGMVTYDLTSSTATFTPSANLAFSTTYTATLTTVARDTSGYALGSNHSWSFTTEAAPSPLPTPPVTPPVTASPSPPATPPITPSPTPAVTSPVTASPTLPVMPPVSVKPIPPVTSPVSVSPTSPVAPSPTTPPPASTNWGLIGGIIAAVAIIILIAFAVIRRRGVKSKS